MDKLGYSVKSFFSKVRDFFHSTEFLRVYDKIAKWVKRIVPKIAIYFTLIAFSYIFMFPILRVLIDSFKEEADLVNPDVVWIPHTLTLKNYLNASSALWIFKKFVAMNNAWMSSLLNSTIYSLITALLQTIVACFAGYAFARFNFKGKNFWFAGVIIAFIMPLQLLTLPRSIMLRPFINSTSSASKILGISQESAMHYQIDGLFSFLTTLPSIVLTMLGQGLNSSILIFIFYSFFKMIPIALDEAAQIDGANFWQIFTQIILKMSTSTIFVVFLFAFIWNWNDVYQLRYLTALAENNLGFKTLPQALSSFNYVISQGSASSGIMDSDSHNNAGLKSAGILVSILPLLILYAFTQRKFVEGIENTGVTGV